MTANLPEYVLPWPVTRSGLLGREKFVVGEHLPPPEEVDSDDGDLARSELLFSRMDRIWLYLSAWSEKLLLGACLRAFPGELAWMPVHVGARSRSS